MSSRIRISFYIYLRCIKQKRGLGIGDWGLGIGDWAQSPIANDQYAIPNAQSPIPSYKKSVIIKLKN